MDMLQRDSSFVFAVAQNQQTEVRRHHPRIKLNAYRTVLIPSTEHEERAQTAEIALSKALKDRPPGQVTSR
jgi:pterin-4a-carbinolamine dehydratase